MQSSKSVSSAHLGPLQIALLALAGIAAVAGAIVCIVDPTTLTFHAYVTEELPALAGALGLGMVGKGIHLNGVAQAAGAVAQLEPVAAQVMTALEKGDLAGALGAFESGVPKGELPSDHAERFRPAPTPREAAPGLDGNDQPPPAAATPPEPPAPQESPPVPPEAKPLTPEELAVYEELSRRVAATTKQA